MIHVTHTKIRAITILLDFFQTADFFQAKKGHKHIHIPVSDVLQTGF